MVQGLVTVIVPCFNYGRYLRECVDSLVNQSYRQWECIIVDDGSTDDTPAICAQLVEMDRRVHALRQSNCGLSAARNAGLRRASGEFIQLLDADDLLQPEKLAAHADYLQTNPPVDIVSGPAAFFDKRTGDRLREWRSRRLEGGGIVALEVLLKENPLLVNSPLSKRHVFESVGLFDEKLRAHEDWEFWLRCALKGFRFAYHSGGPKSLALVRQHGRNMSTARPMMLDTAMAVREMLQKVIPEDLRQVNLEGLAKLKARRGVDLIRAGQVSAGWAIYMAGMRLTQRRMTYMLQLLRLVPGVQYALSSLRSWNLSR